MKNTLLTPKIELFDSISWQNLATESYVQDYVDSQVTRIALPIIWDLLNDNTNVLWQQDYIDPNINIEDIALKTSWNLLNDNIEVIWQQQ